MTLWTLLFCVKIILVVGEYAGDYGFWLPNPVSIHRECLRSWLQTEWCICILQKIKYTWYICWGIFMPYKIQPEARFWGWWYRWHIYKSDADGNPTLFNVNRNDSESWLNNDNGNPDNEWNGNNRFVFLSRKSFYFSSTFIGLEEFCFINCPFQPPNILPISSRRIDTEIYFLSSIDFVSHNTININFKVSNFFIECFTHGSFSDFGKKLATDIASIVSINSRSIRSPRVCLWIFGIVV